MTNELRSELAKLIYSMNAKQQKEFRSKFPTPIEDWQVESATKYAEQCRRALKR